MKSSSSAHRVALVAIATILLLASASMAWATVHDYETRGFIPNGVSVAGADLSHMTESEARAAIQGSVSDPLSRPITVSAAGQHFSFDPKDAVTVDIDKMVDEAFAPRRQASFVSRMRHDAGNVRLVADIEPRYTVDAGAIKTWVDGISREFNLRAVDATISVAGHDVKVRRSRAGRTMQVDEAQSLMMAAFESDAALQAGDRVVEVPVKTVKPKVTEKNLGKTITVDQSERMIRVFNGGKLEKTYPCAIGTPDHPTPLGHFEVVLKRYMPTWVNPAPNGWGATMPKSIPPGPNNPLGTRAINLSASGIRFHGTNAISSVGTAASHGCMRMYRSDIENLYDRIDVGTQVYIVP